MKSSLPAITCKPIRSLLAAVLVLPFLPAAAAPPSLGEITIHQLADRRVIIKGDVRNLRFSLTGLQIHGTFGLRPVP